MDDMVKATDGETNAGSRSGFLAKLSRLVVVAFAGSALAVGLTVNPATATTAGACGWYVERNGPVGGVWVWDGSVGAWNLLQFEIVTYNDGCGSRFYRLYEWDSTGTPATLSFNLRIWVCGVQQRTVGWTAFGWSSGFVQSPSYYYGGCGRQADDAWSSISSGWFSPTSGSAYVTAS